MSSPPPSDHDGGRSEHLGVYEMLWDCAYCGQKRLLGKTHRHCPTCGAAQDDTALRYYPSDEEAVAVEDHELVGSDLICGACRSPCSSRAQHCPNCGSSLAGVRVGGARSQQSVREGQAFAAESVGDARREREAAAAPERPRPAPAGGGSRRWLIVAVAGLAIVVGLWLLFRKHEQGVVIAGHAWEREIEIESYGPQSASSWCDAVPAGAYRITRTREQRSTRNVPDGEECSQVRHDNGDGTFSKRRECKPKYRSEPVLDDKCHYVVDRWARSRSVKASGTLTDAPRWPEAPLRAGTCVGCEREGSRNARYTLEFSDESKHEPGRCEVSEAQWGAAPVGSRWIIRVGMAGADCGTMKPAR